MLRNSNKFYFNPGSEKKPPVFEISEADKPFLDAEIEKHAEELAAQDIRNAKNPNWDEFGHYKHVNLTRLIEEKRFKCHMDEINEKLAGKKESLKVQPIAYQQFIESIAGMSFFDKKNKLEKMVESGFADADFLISIIKEDKDMLSKLAAIEAIKLLDGNEAEKALEFIVDFYTGKMADEVLFDNDPIAELRLDEKLSEDESFYIYSNYQTYDEDTHDFYNRMASACIGIFGHFGRRAQTHFLRPF